MNHLQSVKYVDGKLSVIDQLKLPGELVYVDVTSQEDAWDVIRKMQVRGAPLIGMVAALGLAVDVNSKRNEVFSTPSDIVEYILKSTAYLRTSRPTAAPLFIVMDKLDKMAKDALKNGKSVNEIVDMLCICCAQMLQEDVDCNKAMGDYGVDYITTIVQRKKLRVLTICNTGSLATAGYGTALGVIRTLHARGQLEHVYACETRPYNQGARLTAFEIVYDKLPGTLIPDSAASALMAVKGIDVVIVGGDRVTANGDLANKIGTYQLALAANYHNIPFFTAITTSVVDVSMASGNAIKIEERPGGEMTSIGGYQIAPEGIGTWNPAFDVTPSSLLHGIITEVGVATHTNSPAEDDDRMINMVQYMVGKGLIAPPSEEKKIEYAKPVKVPVRWYRLSEESAVEYVCSDEEMSALIGLPFNSSETAADRAARMSSVSVKEVGDGNLNFVFIIQGPENAIVVKQSLPYVRCVGENWPLTLERATFEAKALMKHHSLCPDHVPKVHRFDESMAVIVMEYIKPPNIILRNVLIKKERHTSFASHMASFVSKTLYGTSGLVLSGKDIRKEISYWSQNSSMCDLTEQVIFTDPYYPAEFNHWEKVSPNLDVVIKEGIYKDSALKIAIAALKAKFLTNPQSLLHGDLHTGSIMVEAGSTTVIDPEFGFYGPMGFDTGLFVANILFAYCSHCLSSASDGSTESGASYADWLLTQLVSFYTLFEKEFITLWESDIKNGVCGGMYSHHVYVAGEEGLKAAQKEFLDQVWKDTIGFAGAEMVRRIVGIAHVAELDSDTNPSITGNGAWSEEAVRNHRSCCQYLTLVIGRALMMASVNTTIGGTSRDISDVSQLVQVVRELSQSKVISDGKADFKAFTWPHM